MRTTKTFSGLLFLAIISLSNVSCANDTDTKTVTPAPDTTPKTVSIENKTADAPIVHGEEAHKNHCYKCHTDDVYTRENRFVKSIDALSQQVVRCKDGSNVPWFEEDSEAVVQFLNNKYYKF